jgi:outer membrane protein assembly factor BamB
VVNGIVYVCPNGSNPQGFNATTGALVWTSNTTTLGTGPAIANGIFYTGSMYDGPLSAVNASTGATIWTATALTIDPPAVANGIVYAGATNGLTSDGTFNESLSAFNATTGATLWTAPSGSFGNQASEEFDFSSPVVANGVVYVGSADGNVYAFGLP